MKTTLYEINEAAKDPIAFINECENAYSEHIRAAAKAIADNDDIKVVAISGPSASGKTTTAHILKRELTALREKAEVVSLDDFYKNMDELPLDEDGDKDYETVEALDKEVIKKCFGEIVKTGKTKLPQYDFKTHTRTDNAKDIDVGTRGIVISEGLHALNSDIAGLVPQKNIYKIYISVNLPVEGENGITMLSSRQVRLARRIIRDIENRGNTPRTTLSIWNNVVEGEVKYLYPYADNVDCRINTLIPYELCVYRKKFCALRDTVDRGVPWYDYYLKTANALELFADIEESFVPQNSLIREFIGK